MKATSKDRDSPEPKATSQAKTRTQRLILSSLGMLPYMPDPADLAFSTKDFGRKIRRLDDHTVVKYGPDIKLREAEAMIYVSKKTTVQCPKVIGAYILDGWGYIIMTYERGALLSNFWPQASEADRKKVIDQLHRYLNDMRSIEQDYIGGFGRTHCSAGEFMWDFDPNHKYGPYKDEDEFNAGIIRALYRKSASSARVEAESEVYQKTYQKEKQLVNSHRGHKIVFTHGDLCAVNILIKPDNTVVILDWESAGFYPEYWEWYKATWAGSYEPSFDMQAEKFIPPFPREAEDMAHVYQKIIG
jgi:aminoglycoside phosphotransferase